MSKRRGTHMHLPTTLSAPPSFLDLLRWSRRDMVRRVDLSTLGAGLLRHAAKVLEVRRLARVAVVD